MPDLARENHLELFLAARASHRRGIWRVRWDVQMLAGHEARTDVPMAERTLDLVVIEGATIDRDPPPLIDLLHATSLGCVPAPKGRTKIASETKTLKVGDVAPDF